MGGSGEKMMPHSTDNSQKGIKYVLKISVQ